MTELGQIQMDALKEISNIGAGNAAMTLSEMTKEKVDINVLNIEIEPIENVCQILGGEGKIISTIYFVVNGQIQGSILLILSPDESLNLIRMLTKTKVSDINSISENELSALKELGNIFVGNYLRAINQVLRLKMTYSIPGFTSDMLGSVLNRILASLSLKTQQAVMVENEFSVGENISKIQFIFIPDPESLKTILDALGVGK